MTGDDSPVTFLKIRLDDIKITFDELKSLNEIVITACGTSYHAGLVGKYAIETLTRIPVDVLLTPVLTVIPLQLFAYYTARCPGLQPGYATEFTKKCNGRIS